ncbi:uncharacterized protein Osi2 [Prorops nasuta]|uniref:uncharacterized protein Osi2 n=1 Tax=Prorops nasuta TaxID=863751 RepID=UPI0034D00430
MRLIRLLVSCVLALSSCLLVHAEPGGRVTFADGASEGQGEERGKINLDQNGPPNFNKTRQGKDLFDWIGLGTGNNVDPYLSRANQGCLNGDLAECFKSRALNTFEDFFDQAEYNLNEHVKVIRMPREVVKEVNRQPYEYSSAPRAEESEWDQLVKFAARKAEKFVKTVAFEVSVPSSETGEDDMYAPRFLDEIADEIDTLEDKKDTLFSRHRLRKMLIPMLIVLKLFKLKLLLFLPLILGLASFKKFLGFMAIVIPGLIGFFKLCKPLTQNYQPPVYSQSGVGYPLYKEGPGSHHYGSPEGYHGQEYSGGYRGDSVSFGQDLAYQGYRDYHSH